MPNRTNPQYPDYSRFPYLDDQGVPTDNPEGLANRPTNASGTTGDPSVNAITNTQPAATTATTPAQTTQPTQPQTAKSTVPDITQQDTAYQAIVQQARDDLDTARQDVLQIQKQIDDQQHKLQTGGPNGGPMNAAAPG